MDWFKLNGKECNVIVTELSENFTILYSENSGRTLEDGAPMYLDPLGTFVGHKVKVKRRQGFEKESFDCGPGRGSSDAVLHAEHCRRRDLGGRCAHCRGQTQALGGGCDERPLHSRRKRLGRPGAAET